MKGATVTMWIGRGELQGRRDPGIAPELFTALACLGTGVLLEPERSFGGNLGARPG